MIVIDEAAETLLLVRQSDHARLSSELAAAWDVPSGILPHEVWPRLIEAVRRHDDGWDLADDRPRVGPTGRPYDYRSMPSQYHLEIWRRSVELADQGDSYVSLLVAQHARWLYTHHSSEVTLEEQQAAQAFLDELTLRVARDLGRVMADNSPARLAARPQSLSVARRLFTFFDGLSLMLLKALSIPERTEKLAFQHRESELILQQGVDRQTMIISPWPFQPAQLQLSVPAIHVDCNEFTGTDDLLQAIDLAPRVTLGWSLRTR